MLDGLFERKYLPRKEDISKESIGILFGIIAGFFYRSVIVGLWGYLIITSVDQMGRLFWKAWSDPKMTDTELIDEYGNGPIVLFMMIASGSWILMMIYEIIPTTMWTGIVAIILLVIGGLIGAVVTMFGIHGLWYIRKYFVND